MKQKFLTELITCLYQFT